MDSKLLQEVLDILCGDRTLFYYYPDKYTIFLLERVINKQKETSIRDLRNSQWQSLLSRPLLKDLVSKCGNGKLIKSDLLYVGSENFEPFVLTLGKWGSKKEYSWSQTSRPGANLVLHLNMSEKWSNTFNQLFGTTANNLFDCYHPLSEKRNTTLAWSRIDLDFDSGELLIEEIQSDFIKFISRMKVIATNAMAKKKSHFWFRGVKCESQIALKTAAELLSQFEKIWHEAMLTATLEFAFEELGMTSVYYHSFETCVVLRNLKGSRPPKSLYTQLPKKFCFNRTEEMPSFIESNRQARRRLKKVKNNSWFKIAA